VDQALRDKLARRFRGQARSCAELGSPLYAELLERAATDLERGGPVWQAVEPVAGLPGGALVALRYLGATHRLALSGAAPELAARYPSCGGDGDPVGAWSALAELSERAAAAGTLEPLLRTGVQTNEVGRSAALLGGFLEVSRRWDLPLRVLEVGSSGGLNLRWDRFRYSPAGGPAWGPVDSPVDQGDPWVGPRRPRLHPPAGELELVERRGCDLAPVDPSTPDGRLTLLSFVWPDMDRRFRLLDGACEVARGLAVTVDRASADEWLAARLAEPAEGAATVVFHSVVLQYVDPDARSRLVSGIAAAGRAAHAGAPLAWLRLEPAGALGPADMEVRLTLWPGGEDRRLATSHPHGTWIRWEQ